MYENRFTDLNITTVPTSTTTHPDSLNLMHHDTTQNTTNAASGVIQSSTDSVGQHNNNDHSQMNNNHLNQGIKSENQSPSNNGATDEQDSSR